MDSPTSGAVYYVAFCLLGLWPRVGWVAALLIPSNFTTTRTIMDLMRKDAVKPRMEKSPTASVPDILVFNYKI
ncbi:hypothetical protein PPACK8108_LOCUS15959 [Phakopsora pachyrhizi]|uniref:Uncharacterized protein n=1 Tax=Phakopsora pachyrhizi TaxID=170000 RepID=A0AAV0B795_PHAPC|nr:hypothetical protein PPACK8108_LOCUS15959 [Phakopsora pachyrhizi]